MKNARRLREGLGLSQPDVMRATGIDHSHLSKFERGEARLSQENLQALAGLYGCKIDDLLAEGPEPVAAE